MSSKATNYKVPLNEQDQKVLSEIFSQINIEDIQQMEATFSTYLVAPLEPWEEQGWIVNSSLPSKSS